MNCSRSATKVKGSPEAHIWDHVALRLASLLAAKLCSAFVHRLFIFADVGFTYLLCRTRSVGG